MTIGLETIRAAHVRVAPHIHRTPVLSSRSLNALAGARLFFKCENLQKTGSFKIRGAANAVFSLNDEEARRGVITHSSGNHAAALSYAARLRGIPAWIVMPQNAPAAKCRAVEAYGGQITFCEPSLPAREAAAQEVMQRTGAILIHPYNDERIIAGQATAAMELLQEVPDLDVVLAPVSGGGLLCGTALSARLMRQNVRVIGCEPRNADDAYRSLAAGSLQPMDHPDTLADGLRASLCELTFSIIRELVDQIVLVAESEIVDAMRLVWERMKVIAEPSSAVAVAPALHKQIDAQGRHVGIILSGGNVDLARLPFL
jgi:threonine dehydratase